MLRFFSSVLSSERLFPWLVVGGLVIVSGPTAWKKFQETLYTTYQGQPTHWSLYSPCHQCGGYRIRNDYDAPFLCPKCDKLGSSD